MRAKNNDTDTEMLIDSSVSINGSASYAEKWSLHPGEALRRKRGISTKDQQVLAKNPVVLAQDVFESSNLRSRAFYADENCLIFCGEVCEVLGWLREAGLFAVRMVAALRTVRYIGDLLCGSLHSPQNYQRGSCPSR